MTTTRTRCFNQVSPHGRRSRIDDIRLIVKGDDLSVAWQLEAGDLLLDLLDDLLPVFAAKNDDHAGYGFAFAVPHNGPVPRQSRSLDRGHLPE